MREEFKRFFNENMLLSPHGEDDILYTAEFAVLSDEYTPDMAYTAINSLHHPHHEYGPLYIDEFYPAEEDQTWSHDMHTGLICLSKLRGLDAHNHWLSFNCWRRLQPWNVAFYLFIMEGPLHLIGLLLLPILSLYMIYTLRFPTYSKAGILDTSGALLIFLMLNTVNMPITKRICESILKSKIGNWFNYANVYFGEDHPITILMKEKGL